MKGIKAFVAKVEKSKAGEQVFRFGRIALIAIASYAVTHNGVDSAAITGGLEVAFRQVFPSA